MKKTANTNISDQDFLESEELFFGLDNDLNIEIEKFGPKERNQVVYKQNTTPNIEELVVFNVENYNRREYHISKKCYIESDGYSIILFINKKTPKPIKKRWVVDKTANKSDGVSIMVDVNLIDTYNINVNYLMDEATLSKKIVVSVMDRVVSDESHYI